MAIYLKIKIEQIIKTQLYIQIDGQESKQILLYTMKNQNMQTYRQKKITITIQRLILISKEKKNFIVQNVLWDYFLTKLKMCG